MSRVELHAFTRTADGIRKELRIPISLAPAGDEINKDEKFTALIDTGATNCSITKRAAQKIGAIPCSMVDVVGVHGAQTVPLFMLDLLLPSNVSIQGVQASEMDDAASFDVLIGMDVLTQGDFCITNFQGKTVFTFRTPSLEMVDYTSQIPAGYSSLNRQNKVGRNDPCPCGSGLKFKKCHGKP